jgi:hypothetical protein
METKEKRICKKCGKEFTIRISCKVYPGSGNYCSKKCQIDSYRTGRYYKGKLCKDGKEYNKLYAKDHKKELLEYQKNYRKINKEKNREINRERQRLERLNNPEKARARDAAYREKAKGNIKKEKCKICGSNKSEMHHPNYSSPLRVVWLCDQCHRDVHTGKITL